MLIGTVPTSLGFGFPVVNAGGAHCRLMADRRRLSAAVLGFFELGREGFDVREVC